MERETEKKIREELHKILLIAELRYEWLATDLEALMAIQDAVHKIEDLLDQVQNSR